MTGFVGDIRHALRSAFRTPVSSAIVVGSLTIGIAANTTVFSFVNAIRFKPLPVQDEATLVDLSETSATELCAGCAVGTSYPGFLDWKSRLRSLAAVGAYREQSLAVSGGITAPERTTGALVSARLFAMLGTAPALGREFGGEDDREGAPPVVIIGDRVWERRFGRAPGALGKTLKVNGVAHEVVGVMPARFGFPEFAEIWIPLAPNATGWTRDDRSLGVIGRMAPGAAISSVRSELRVIAASLARVYPETNAGWDAGVSALRADMTGETAMGLRHIARARR
jgi:hypothetical protein